MPQLSSRWPMSLQPRASQVSHKRPWDRDTFFVHMRTLLLYLVSQLVSESSKQSENGPQGTCFSTDRGAYALLYAHMDSEVHLGQRRCSVPFSYQEGDLANAHTTSCVEDK